MVVDYYSSNYSLLLRIINDDNNDDEEVGLMTACQIPPNIRATLVWSYLVQFGHLPCPFTEMDPPATWIMTMVIIEFTLICDWIFILVVTPSCVRLG